MPAGALASEVGLVRLSALLDRLQARDVPLFVHPGPAPSAHRGAPAWWPAMTAYVADMHAAWHAWAAWGRRSHPRLRVLFAMLAGGAPLHAERLAARGGPADAVHDELTFFDVSSYGPRTVDAMLRVVGADRLVYGSDRPVAEPPALGALGPVRRARAGRGQPRPPAVPRPGDRLMLLPHLPRDLDADALTALVERPRRRARALARTSSPTGPTPAPTSSCTATTTSRSG